jgi:hypothetical protein
MTDKEAKIDAKRKSLEDGKRGDLRKSRLEAEAKVKEARAADLAKKTCCRTESRN